MHDDIAKIDQHPSVLRLALNSSTLAELFLNPLCSGIRQGLQHAIAGARANNEILCKIGEVMNVHQDDIFTFFIFQNIYKVACNLNGFQDSPLFFKPITEYFL